MEKKLQELISEYDTIIIHRHSRPDGDALGSQLGLKRALLDNFSNKKVYAVGDKSVRYSFIGEIDEISDETYRGALVFILDSSETSLVSDLRYQKGEKIIKIDHHIKRESFGDLEIVDESFESCCGLVADLLIKMNMKISKEAATCLYTGMVTDSGRFRFDSTTPKTFMIASKLLESNIDILDIYNNLYLDDFEMVVLRAKYVLKIKFTEHNVAYIKTTSEELEELNTDFFTVSRSMVNTMAGIKNVDIWVNFTEDKDTGIIVEIRSNKYNINPIAVKYGGGGHAKASGTTVASFEEADKLLKDLDDLCK